MTANPSVPIVYLRFRKRVSVRQGEPVLLGHVAELFAEPELKARLRRMELYKPEEEDGNRLLVDILRVMAKAREIVPDVQIELFGEPHALVEIAAREKKPNAALIVLVWLLLFIGSGLTIMNFHKDVSMPDVHRRLYELITGRQEKHPYALQIPYSIGIGIGMALFFNHLFKRKFNEEPSPLEVEMFLYQQNINQYVITEEYRKMHDGGDGEDIGRSGP